MADDLPEYCAFLLTQPCACHPCVMPVEVHHHTAGEAYAPGARPPKAIGGKRGKSQRASDYYGIPLCGKHHDNLHRYKGYFKGWSGAKLREWQDRQVRKCRARYESKVEQEPARPTSAVPAQPRARATGGAAEAARQERLAIVELIRDLAGNRRYTPDAAAALQEAADTIEARGAVAASAPPDRCTSCGDKSRDLVQGICGGCREMLRYGHVNEDTRA